MRFYITERRKVLYMTSGRKHAIADISDPRATAIRLYSGMYDLRDGDLNGKIVYSSTNIKDLRRLQGKWNSRHFFDKAGVL